MKVLRSTKLVGMVLKLCGATTKISGPVSNFSIKGNLAISWAKRGFPFPSLSISESSRLTAEQA